MLLFKLEYEDLGDMALIHCEVDEWNISVARKLDEAVGNFFNQLWEEGYLSAVTFSPNPKFCEYMGGERIGEGEMNGNYYGIYRWDLKPPQ
jgi:hypothetical protein